MADGVSRAQYLEDIGVSELPERSKWYEFQAWRQSNLDFEGKLNIAMEGALSGARATAATRGIRSGTEAWENVITSTKDFFGADTKHLETEQEALFGSDLASSLGITTENVEAKTAEFIGLYGTENDPTTLTSAEQEALTAGKQVASFTTFGTGDGEAVGTEEPVSLSDMVSYTSYVTTMDYMAYQAVKSLTSTLASNVSTPTFANMLTGLGVTGPAGIIGSAVLGSLFGAYAGGLIDAPQDVTPQQFGLVAGYRDIEVDEETGEVSFGDATQAKGTSLEDALGISSNVSLGTNEALSKALGIPASELALGPKVNISQALQDYSSAVSKAEAMGIDTMGLSESELSEAMADAAAAEASTASRGGGDRGGSGQTDTSGGSFGGGFGNDPGGGFGPAA